MVDTVFPFQVVLFTQHYSISGGLFLREQRLSDFLNDRRDTIILMRNTSVARLEQPAKILEKTASSIIPKAGIVLAFEPPQKTTPQTRFIKYPKQKYDVFLALDGMEVHGKLNQCRARWTCGKPSPTWPSPSCRSRRPPSRWMPTRLLSSSGRRCW